MNSEKTRKKIFLASNSQGTSAGTSPEFTYSNVLQDLLGDSFDVHRMLISGWTLKDFSKSLTDNVLCISPDLVVMNFGIVEGAQRILSRWEKTALSLVPGSRHLTSLLHLNRERVLFIRNQLGLSTRNMSLEEYSDCISYIVDILEKNKVKYLFLLIPLFADEGKSIGNPYINQDIKLFNSALNGLPSLDFRLFPGGWTMDDFKAGTVHFSPSGHRKIAESLENYILSTLRTSGIES